MLSIRYQHILLWKIFMLKPSSVEQFIITNLSFSTFCLQSRDGSSDITKGYGVRFPAEAMFSLPDNFQTGSGAHSASYPMGTGDSFTGIKEAGT
jgi:hypothetical protein